MAARRITNGENEMQESENDGKNNAKVQEKDATSREGKTKWRESMAIDGEGSTKKLKHNTPCSASLPPLPPAITSKSTNRTHDDQVGANEHRPKAPRVRQNTNDVHSVNVKDKTRKRPRGVRIDDDSASYDLQEPAQQINTQPYEDQVRAHEEKPRAPKARKKANGIHCVNVRDVTGAMRACNLKTTDLVSLPEGKRIIVDWNRSRQPYKHSGKLLTYFLGKIARNANYFPINHQNWHFIPEPLKENVWKDIITARFEVNDNEHKNFIMQDLGKKWQDWRRLRLWKTNHCSARKSRDFNLEKHPKVVPYQQWIDYVDYRLKSKTKELGEQVTMAAIDCNGGTKEMKKKCDTIDGCAVVHDAPCHDIACFGPPPGFDASQRGNTSRERAHPNYEVEASNTIERIDYVLNAAQQRIDTLSTKIQNAHQIHDKLEKERSDDKRVIAELMKKLKERDRAKMDAIAKKVEAEKEVQAANDNTMDVEEKYNDLKKNFDQNVVESAVMGEIKGLAKAAWLLKSGRQSDIDIDREIWRFETLHDVKDADVFFKHEEETMKLPVLERKGSCPNENGN